MPKKSPTLSRRRFLAGTGAAVGAAGVAAGTGVLPGQGLLGGLIPSGLLPGLTDPGGLLPYLGTVTDPLTGQLGITINPPAPPTPSDINADVLHRLRRWTYGPTSALKASITTPAKTQTYLDQQLKPNTIADGDVEASLKMFPSNRMDTKQCAENYGPSLGRVAGTLGGDYGNGPAILLAESICIKTLRAVHSNRQLQERMTEFWMDHFNVAGIGRFLFYRLHMENSVVRPNAIGKFADLLKGTAKHPAMLQYLDQHSSSKEHPGQNYPRELLELHTLGATSGFTEADVIATSRLLTGLTMKDHKYFWDQARHDTGKVTILGKDWGPNTNEGTVDQFLDWLARQPATAARVAQRLCQYFVTDTPSNDLVQGAAQKYLQNDTAIEPVLRHIFASTEFAQAGRKKLHRPFDHLIATLRGAGINPNFALMGYVDGLAGGLLGGSLSLVPSTNLLDTVSTEYIPNSPFIGAGAMGLDATAIYGLLKAENDPTYQLAAMVMNCGQYPGGWGPPNGYPLVGGAYLSGGAFFRRMSTSMIASAGLAPQAMTNYSALLGFPTKATNRSIFDGIFKALCHRLPTNQEFTLLTGGVNGAAAVGASGIENLGRLWGPIIAALPETNLR